MIYIKEINNQIQKQREHIYLYEINRGIKKQTQMEIFI